jgi:K+-sensing histidine kinase KdpD
MTNPTQSYTEHLADELHALTEVAKALASPFGLSELLEAVMKTIVNVLEPADVGAIMLWDQSAGLFRPAAAIGYNIEILKDIELRSGESITGKVYDEARPRLLRTAKEVEQAMADMHPSNRQVMMRSLGTEKMPHCAVAVPIMVGERKFGVLVLETLDHNKQFNEDNLAFLHTLADLVALAIDRERLKTKADNVRDIHQVERMRSEVMATLSHELRMPLSTIKGYSTALLMDELQWSDEKHKELLHLIEEACDDMEGMLKDMLDSSLIEVERLEMERQPMRLPHIARDLTTEIQQRNKIHTPVVDFPPDFPIVEADPRWIRQVFRNIIDNAVKYSPEGGLIVIKGETRPTDVVISVADQGIGISPENLIPLFEKYHRVQSPASLHVPGTGLGLLLARTIIEAHGGRIWIESKVGEGTTVCFSLPHNTPAPLRTSSRSDSQPMK